MTNLEQIIIDKIHRFPPEKQQKVLDFAETLEEPEAAAAFGKSNDLGND